MKPKYTNEQRLSFYMILLAEIELKTDNEKRCNSGDRENSIADYKLRNT
jgi:hypothetical protein